MKKIFALLLVTVLGLAGCSAAATPANYQGEVKTTDQEGKETVTTVTYTKTGDDITDVKFTATKDGVDKSDPEKYPMVKVGKASAEWADQAAMVAKFIDENNGVDKLNLNAEGGDADAVTGATIGLTDFVDAFKAAQEVK
ncbi:MAG: hypothetical protein ACRCUP_04800 [Mycoplasmatales bacterium]